MNRASIFLSPIKVLRKHYFLLITVSILRGVIQFGYVYIMKYIAQSIQEGNMQYFRTGIGILLAAIVANFAIQFFNNYYVNIVMYKTSNYLNATHLKYFLQLDNNIVEKYGTGRMGSIFQRGVIAWLTLMWELTTAHTRIATVLVISIAYLARQGRQFLLIGIGILVVMIFWIYLFQGKIERSRRKVKEITGEIDRNLVRWIMSKFEILQLGRYDMEVERDNKMQIEWAKTRIKEKVRSSISYDGTAFLVQAIVAGILIYVGYYTIQGTYGFADYVFFVGLMTLFNGIVSELSNIAKQYSDQWVHISKLFEVLYDKSHQSMTIFQGEEFAYQKGDIIFNNVSYNYGNGSVVDHLSMRIVGGKKTALVGPSGGGKTTLTKLISGYLQPTEGQILVDDQDIANINISSYYRHLGYLTQDPLIFDGTVRENLVYSFIGQPSEEQLKEALLRAKCDFVFDLTQGLDSEIGERGIRLSGGQRQRLAIAKLFLKDPEIIILDEPTSALDSVNELAVTEAFNNLFSGRTVIIIAHRLQTVKGADEILIIEQGKIVERGTHTQLSNSGGTYQRMLELQSGFVG